MQLREERVAPNSMFGDRSFQVSVSIELARSFNKLVLFTQGSHARNAKQCTTGLSLAFRNALQDVQNFSGVCSLLLRGFLGSGYLPEPNGPTFLRALRIPGDGLRGRAAWTCCTSDIIRCWTGQGIAIFCNRRGAGARVGISLDVRSWTA